MSITGSLLTLDAREVVVSGVTLSSMTINQSGLIAGMPNGHLVVADNPTFCADHLEEQFIFESPSEPHRVRILIMGEDGVCLVEPMA